MQLRLSGEMAEWSNAAVLKTVVPKGTGGSNPSLSATSKKWLYSRDENPRRGFDGAQRRWRSNPSLSATSKKWLYSRDEFRAEGDKTGLEENRTTPGGGLTERGTSVDGTRAAWVRRPWL